jgi:hypothetical protein
MNRDFAPTQIEADFRKPVRTSLTRSHAAPIHTEPDDVVNDATLTSAQKRALLASWISDARAVQNAPALRRLDSGAIVEVDAIRRALSLLDESAPARRESRDRPRPATRQTGVILNLLNRVGRTRSSDDDDDDPPPAPAGLGVPLRPSGGAAYAAPPERLPEFAYAAA